MKKVFLIACFIFWLTSANEAFAWTSSDAGIQRYHQNSVPQINSSGKIQNSYTSDSFFPLVLSWYDSNYLQQIKDAEFNTLSDADINGAPLPIQNYDKLSQYGFKAIPNIHNYIGRGSNNSVANGDWSVLTNTVNSLKNHPATLAWYLTDESYDDLTTAQWLDVYNHIKTLDPNRAIMNELGDSSFGSPPCTPLKVDMTNFYSYDIFNENTSLGDLAYIIDNRYGQM